eukprot:3974033-Prymnesium_polylepis.1
MAYHLRCKFTCGVHTQFAQSQNAHVYVEGAEQGRLYARLSHMPPACAILCCCRRHPPAHRCRPPHPLMRPSPETPGRSA